MNDKFIGKYMRLAKQFGEDSNPCFSRKIGVIIVDPLNNRISATGYNGSPAGTPHCDSREYLEHFFWPQLTEEERNQLVPLTKTITIDAREADLRGIDKNEWIYNNESLTYTRTNVIGKESQLSQFLYENSGCGICPRRLINAGSGERTELCSCQHAERNAITNAQQSLNGHIMFCWCLLPCIQCTGSIINARIKEVHCLDEPAYHPVSEWLFKKAGIYVTRHKKEEFENVSC